MANIYGYQFRKSPVPEVWELFLKISIGATGAPTIVTANGFSKGLASIVRNNAGDYTLTLTQTWNQFLMLNANFVAANGAASPNVCVAAEAVATAKTIEILCQAGGVNTDPATGEVMLLQLIFKNSTAY